VGGRDPPRRRRDRKQAIEAATKQFNIEPARQNRIVVTKVSKRDDD